MNCTETRSAMLECELTCLTPQGRGEISRHIAQCGDCRARAEAIVARTGALRMALVARGKLRADRIARRARAIGALTMAAGLLIAVVLARRATSAPVAPAPRAAVHASPVTIDNAQGRSVTIVERRETIDVVFHILEPNE